MFNYSIFLNKYSKLMDKLGEYCISRFSDESIVQEYFTVDKFDRDISNRYISVYMTDDEQFKIVIEEKIDNKLHVIEQKFYKTINGAYKFIVKNL